MASRSLRAVLILCGMIAVTGVVLAALPPGGIGIPGLTKTYEAMLSSGSLLPMRVTVCDFVTDAFERGYSVAHSIERWDDGSGEWRLFWGIARQDFCRPYPLGITSESRVRSVWLWPGEAISTSFVAIQASDGLRLGDHLRFAIRPFRSFPEITVVTDPFPVDERPAESGGGFRIRH